MQLHGPSSALYVQGQESMANKICMFVLTVYAVWVEVDISLIVSRISLI